MGTTKKDQMQNTVSKTENNEQTLPDFDSITTTCNGIKQISVKPDAADVKFEGLSFSPAQIDHLVRLQRGGSQLRITLQQIQGELFEDAPNG